MNIIKFDPFRSEFRSLHNEINKLFAGLDPQTGHTGEFAKGAWAPSVDIYEDENRLVLEAELPGLKRDDFELTVENNILTLRGDRKFSSSRKGDNYHRIERAYGAFTRQFTLPQTVTSEGATADFRDGVLRVELAKREETKARKIEIGVTSESEPKSVAATSGK